jgi:hypothetical protein
MTNFWFCEVGPGWKPDAEALAEDTRHNLELRRQRVAHQAAQAQARAHGHGIAHPEAMQAAYDSMYPMLGWVPSNNPFERQWQVVPLRAPAAAAVEGKADKADTTSVDVDMGAAPWLAGREPLAIRLGWPLFGIPYSPADTCCPTATVQAGRGVCIPGNCPLYSETSELPANPFFAQIKGGKCECPAPQVCSA